MGKWLRRLRYLTHQRRVEAELAEELEFHRAQKQQRLEEAGVLSAEAADSARRALGNVTLSREDARGVWIAPWLQGFTQDLAYAFRAMARQPGFSLVAIGTLAAAIGLNTTLLTIYSAFALRPWPAVPDADRVVTIYNGTGPAISHAPHSSTSPNTRNRSRGCSWCAAQATTCSALTVMKCACRG